MTSKIEELKEEVKTVYQTTSGDGFIKWLDKAYTLGREEAKEAAFEEVAGNTTVESIREQGIKIGIEKAVEKIRAIDFTVSQTGIAVGTKLAVRDEILSSLASDERGKE